ncbi:MAG: hypothetical protein H0X42_00915 [Solirubrobacterales bacterium]|nr:hypothetical protein [Solirubrobacterales bacterium]
MSDRQATPDPNDERDPEVAEELAARDPDGALRRREFLQRAAVTGGLAAGLAGILSPDTILAQAAKISRAPVPDPRNVPLDTIIVLMMENRSFDHYLGWLPGADGRQGGLVFNDAAGNPHDTHRLAPDFQGCAHPDPDHSWLGGRQQLDGGRMDGFLRSGENDVFSIGYYAEQDLPFIPAAARAFTTFDRFFCSILASTYPNREYMHAAQSYGRTDNTMPFGPGELGFPDSTIFNALSAKGISNHYFYTDIPVSALWGAPGLARSSRGQHQHRGRQRRRRDDLCLRRGQPGTAVRHRRRRGGERGAGMRGGPAEPDPARQRDCGCSRAGCANAAPGSFAST